LGRVFAIIITMITKQYILWFAVLILGVALTGVYFWTSKFESVSTPSALPEPSLTASPSATPVSSNFPKSTKTPLPTGDGRTTFVDEPVPWSLLLGGASCELKGEIKFLNGNTYDNQDALFTYGGIDHPARNIIWTVTPDDGSLSVGPNMFSKMQLPYSQSLLGIFILGEPKSKRYELTVAVQYGRLVDENGKFVAVGGNVKVFEKQCWGKTIVVLP